MRNQLADIRNAQRDVPDEILDIRNPHLNIPEEFGNVRRLFQNGPQHILQIENRLRSLTAGLAAQ